MYTMYTCRSFYAKFLELSIHSKYSNKLLLSFTDTPKITNLCIQSILADCIELSVLMTGLLVGQWRSVLRLPFPGFIIFTKCSHSTTSIKYINTKQFTVWPIGNPSPFLSISLSGPNLFFFSSYLHIFTSFNFESRKC